MKKSSSLGRRSSIIGTGRISNIEKYNRNVSNESKKSFIPKPTRCSSVERESIASSSKKDSNPPSTLRRSRSFLDLRRNSACQTPIQFGRRITTGGSTCGRPSSTGGPKSARKESRPVTDKSFQIGAQTKIQEFFLSRRPDLLDKGSIKPMTAGMFADLVNFLIQKFDKKMIITRANIMEEVPNICKILNYKGKAEKSWLMTVNAPHSWPYVVSFLVWLVEINITSEALNLFETLYPEKVDDEEIDNGDINFKLLVPHLLKGYKLTDDSQEMNEYVQQFTESQGITEEDIERLQKEYSSLQSELNENEDILEEEKYQSTKNSFESLKNDIRNIQDFIYNTENYVSNMMEKREQKLSNFKEYDKLIESLEEEKEKLKAIVSTQEITLDEKHHIENNLMNLREELRELNDEINDYQNEIYKEDLQLVSVRNQFSKSIQAYNKKITVNLALLPNLKSVQIEDVKILHLYGPNSHARFEQIDFNLKELKTSLKNEKRDVEMEVEKENITLQKLEDELALLNEEKDELINQIEHLENDIIHLKKSITEDKDQNKIISNEIKQKLKREKEKMDQRKTTSEELRAAKKEYLDERHEVEEYLFKATEMLKNKKQNLKNFETKLQEITQQRITETKEKVENLLQF